MNYTHDKRLDKLDPGQYRIWHDGQNVLIPKGQSITKPLSTEIVNVNTRVYGEIHQGYFTPPQVDFTNTEVFTERFDRYILQTWREDLPYDQSHIDYHNDLHLNAIKIYYAIIFTCEGFEGSAMGETWIDYQNDKMWLTPVLHFDKYSLSGLRGDFFIITNPTVPYRQRGIRYTTGEFLQVDNLPFTIVMTRAEIFNGNSKMDLLLKNTDFQVELTSFTFEILGGE